MRISREIGKFCRSSRQAEARVNQSSARVSEPDAPRIEIAAPSRYFATAGYEMHCRLVK